MSMLPLITRSTGLEMNGNWQSCNQVVWDRKKSIFTSSACIQLTWKRLVSIYMVKVSGMIEQNTKLKYEGVFYILFDNGIKSKIEGTFKKNISLLYQKQEASNKYWIKLTN